MVFNRTDIMAFHIGRGGRFHNAGHLSFHSENKIDHFTDDLFPNYKNLNQFKGRYGFDVICDFVNAEDFERLEELFGITEQMLGEEVYFDGSGNEVGLSVAEAETGIGCINIDNEYDTTYTKFLADCDEHEKTLIAEYYKLDAEELERLMLID